MAQAQTPAAAAPARKHSLIEVLRALGRPRVAIMLGLGFASGLPFFLTAATLGYWLRDEGTSLKAIGFMSVVGFAYSFKFLWSPIVDRVDLPLFGRLGRRRGWLLLTQVMLALGLTAMALLGPGHGLLALGAAALWVAFSSATQDIAVDALRIESAHDSEELGLFTAAFQLGYRIAVLTSDAMILILAQHIGWNLSYEVMALLMLIGVVSTVMITEPNRAEEVLKAKSAAPAGRNAVDAIAGPFIQFFRSYGWVALVMLLMITLYRLPEFMTVMAPPFYHDLGLQKAFVGEVRLSAGLVGTFTGIAVGGLLAAWLGYVRGLVVGAVLQGLAVASFAVLAIYGADPRLFAAVMFFDNFGVGAAGALLVTYMSSLTSLGYTATQYALLTSIFSWVGKGGKVFSGWMIESIKQGGHTLMEAYAIYFVSSGLVGIPALLLCLLLIWLQRQPAATPGAAPAPNGAS